MEGFCEVNVKFWPGGRTTMLCTMEKFTPFRWSDEAKKAGRMHKLRYEPRAYEFLPLPGLDRALAEEAQTQERERSGLGLYLLGFLFSLMNLPEVEEFSRVEPGNTNAPTSKLPSITVGA